MTKVNKTQSIMAVHDMSGYGKCSLTVVLPVVSAAGVEVYPLPTALLSTSTNYDGFTIFDFTPHIPAYLAHWKQIGLAPDAIYSGFLGSADQINQIKGMLHDFPSASAIIDPVMGDNGVIYKTYTPDMCENMRSLVAVADIVTPNLTEACVLADSDYASVDISPDGIEALARTINKIGAKSVVLTGIERGETLYNCVLEDGNYHEHPIRRYPVRKHGTGDLFTSVLTGGIVTGHTLSQAVDSAAAFVYKVVEHSQTIDATAPIKFEPFLYALRTGLTVW